MKLKIGGKAPSFSLQDQSGKSVALKNFLGQWVVLYFYPKDDTPGCTKEACGFRDNFKAFSRLQVPVLGISADSVERHAKFAQKYTLNFPLLSDPEKKVLEKYGVWTEKKFLGKTFMGILRTTFIVDPEGRIGKIYEKVKPVGHAEAVLKDLAASR